MPQVQERIRLEAQEARRGLTFVTVLVPVYNEAKFIESTLRSILANDHPAERMEVLVIDGMSDDGTREIVEEIAAADSRVTLLDNPRRTVPYALNLGLARSTGDVIIRVDGHARIEPDYIRNCLEELEAHPEAGCVGGSVESVGTTTTGQAISLAMSSPFGVGNARFRLGGEGYVDTLAFGAYRREVFSKVGGFDEELTRNQDGDFNYRLIKAGYRIWMSPRIRSSYSVRSSFDKLFRQYRQYGYWKVFANRKHGAITSWRQVIPALYLMMLVLLALVSLAVPGAALLLAAAAGAWLAGALVAALAKTRQPRLLWRMVVAFLLLHVGYGSGYIEGLVSFVVMRRDPHLGKAELTR